MDSSALLERLDPILLTSEATPLVLWDMGVTDTNKIAQYMYRGGPYPPRASAKRVPSRADDPRPEKRYWDYVETEMHIFLCTDDKKYTALWKELKTERAKSTTAIVAIIAAFLGESVGASATLLTGFVAVCLFAAMKIGKEAYCRYSRSSGA